MLKFTEYKNKFCKGLSETKAYRMYCMYLEASCGSADFAKKEDMKINIATTAAQFSNDMICYGNAFSLAPFPPQADYPVPCNAKQAKQKGNNPMYIDNDKHLESSKINAANDRLESAYYGKLESLPKTFGFADDDAPSTTQEFIDRFVTGKFTVKDVTKKDTKGYFYRPMDNIRWRDPAKVEDQAGYDAAKTAVTKLYQDGRDTLIFGTLADTQAAVKALDAWTPTGAAN